MRIQYMLIVSEEAQFVFQFPNRKAGHLTAPLGLMRSLQKFASVHGSVHNHFNKERHLYSRQKYKENRTAALVEWQQLCAC